MFPGTPAPAQKKRAANRQAFEQQFDAAVASMPSYAPAGGVGVCPWGQEQAEQDALNALLNPASTVHDKRIASEALGEEAAVYMLQAILESNGAAFDPNNLQIFSGANTFNMVYFVPDPAHPTHAIVLEAKGGNSQCGSRTAPPFSTMVPPGTVVDQGTQAYLLVEAEVMQNSGDPVKTAAGKAIFKLASKNTGKVIYTGVRAPYHAKKGVAFEPEVIFSMNI